MLVQRRGVGPALGVLLWGLVVALTSCQGSYSSRYVVKLEPGFSSEQEAAVRAALASWSAKAPVSFAVEDGGGCEEADSVCLWASTKVELQSMFGKDVVGYTQRDEWADRSTVWLALDWVRDPNDVRRVAEHELGHAMGLSHSGPGTIMCPSLDCESQDVTPADVAQYESLR